MTEPFLEGTTVLDFTQYLAGPACTRLLAELGANVIKVEASPSGDPTRDRQPMVDGRAGLFVQQNRGKRSLAVDLRHPEGVALIKDLAAKVDVVVENATPGVMARKGLGYDHLAAINPSIVYASISGFGQYGPYSTRKSFDFIAQAMSGMMHMTGEPDGPPYFVGVGLADTNAGVHAFAGIGYALLRRHRTGKGAHIDVAMTDAMFHMHEFAVQASSLDPDVVPLRQGRHYQPSAPAGTFRCSGGWIVLLCTDQQVDLLWQAMGRSDLSDDPRYATNPLRVQHRAEITELLEDWLATFDGVDQALDALVEAGVPAGKVMSPADAVNDPHFIERGTVRTIDDPHLGSFSAPGFPIKFDGAPIDPPLATASLGEHNHEVLTTLLGWTDAQVAAAESAGVLTSAER
ncbi:MAG: crotonobetainyl-CoA:carnitine CoA-transferase CaiB-like acyl-CoA transferase [Acidimicrobiales bacterium]|jgi:crotonobetainyl-CoA:carnitine CoA-transferase CaiB-like acyl-CoA transferase